MRTVIQRAFAFSLLSLTTATFGCGGDLSARIRRRVELSIAEQPITRPAIAGQTTTFQVIARGLALRYQWLKNGVKIPGATSERYTTPPTKAEDDGVHFQVIVSNWGKSITSNSVTLRVISPESAEQPAFPVKVSRNRRYLVDQENKPFRIQGEAAWSLISNLTYTEAEQYLANRRAKGFNSVLVELIEHKYAQGGKGSKFKGVPTNRNGTLPFTKNADGKPYDGTWGTASFSTPNENYFAFADSIIDLAGQKGMLVNLAPMFLGFNSSDAGWWADLTNGVNTQTAVYSFGLYVGNRYKNRKNIIWIIGGDYTPAPGSEGEARLLRFVEGIKASGASQLLSGDWKASCLSTDETAFAPFMDLNAVYTYGLLGHGGATYDEARAAYVYSPPRPAYLKETGYEGERFFPGDPGSIRMYEYYAILGGSTAGGFFGNRDIWKFATDHWWFDPGDFGHGSWIEAMESRGTLDFVNMGRLLDSLRWYDLVPSGLSGMRKLVTMGAGNYGTTDYVIAAAAGDGTALLAYIPPTRKPAITIGVNMTALSGAARGRWFDPNSGVATQIPGGPFPNVATKAFVSPGINSGGDTDWVLVLSKI